MARRNPPIVMTAVQSTAGIKSVFMDFAVFNVCQIYRLEAIPNGSCTFKLFYHNGASLVSTWRESLGREVLLKFCEGLDQKPRMSKCNDSITKNNYWY
jgi:hypothetical protein